MELREALAKAVQAHQANPPRTPMAAIRMEARLIEHFTGKRPRAREIFHRNWPKLHSYLRALPGTLDAPLGWANDVENDLLHTRTFNK